MKKNLQKLWMLAVLMAFGTVSSWALTADLSMNYELAGYKAKAFYDLTGNADGVLPTEGDLRFRSGYGLFNFGSGGRSGDAAIAVNESDLIVCQFADTQNRGVTINSISGCTKSTTINDGSHIFFEADSELSTLTFGVGRGGCVVSVLVMEVDNSVATAEYTLNYIYDGQTVKTVTATGAVGGQVLTDASFFVDDVKYFRANGEPESFTIAAEGNTFNVNVRLAATWNYSLVSSLGDNIATGSGFEGETVTVGYPRYLLADGAFYEAGKSNNEYRAKIALNEDNTSATVTYTLKEGVNAVFYAEGEKTEGMTVSTAGNIPVRASGAEAGVAEEDVTITTLPAGKYIFHAGIFTSKSSYGENTVNFGIGEQTFSATFTSVNLCEVASAEYELLKSTEIKYLGTSWSDAQFDYIWIEKTGDVEVTPTAVYTVAGGNTDLFGTSWDPTNTANNMTLNAETGLYEWSKADITLAKGTVLFKVTVNNAWDEAYPAQNYELTIEEDGVYDILITFNADTKAVNATATKKGSAEVETVYTVAGNITDLFGTTWDPTNTANDMTLNTETNLYEWSKADVTLAQGTEVQFKVVVNHAWDEAYPDNNYTLNIAEAGTYDILITFNAETKAVNATATKKGATELNTYTATFTTNAGWEKVYAYAWTTTGENTKEYLGAWPGTELTAANGVYNVTIEAEAAPEKIIFNNGNSGEGNQTADLAFENGKAYEYIIEVYEELTDLVENGTFDVQGVVAPWKATGGFQNQTTANNQSGAFGIVNSFFYENWNGSAKVNKMYQEINNIPNGTYKLKIAAFVNTLADPNESQYVYANNDKVYLTTGEPTAYEVTTVVTENKIEIGLEQTTATANWMGIDNVSLSYIGPKNQFVKEMGKMYIEPKQSVKTRNALQAAYDAFVADESDANKDALKAAIEASKVSANSYAVLEAGVLPDNSLAGWTCTNTNTFHINTWSVEGNSDGSGMVTPFIENWVWKGDNGDVVLGTGEIYYSLPGLDPGIYQFSALIRAYSEGGNEPTGASLFAGDREKEFATGKNFEFNGMKGIYDTYAMTAEVGEEGVFKFGIKIAEERNFNWMAFKNCKVAYVGAAIDEAAVNELAATMPEGKMNVDVKAAAEAAIAAVKANINLDNYEAAAKAIAAAQASVAAYEKAKSVLESIEKELEKTNVYTAEAYKANITDNWTAYNEGTFTDAEANALNAGSRLTGILPNVLLSAYTSTVEGTPYINTWSVEGNNDGSEFRTPFYEYWVVDANSLAANTITATMTGLEPGEYNVSAWVRVRIKNDVEAPATGVTLQVNDGETVTIEGTQVGDSRLYLDEYTATGIVGEDGELKIVFAVAEGTNVSWLSFKNVKFQKQVPVPYYIVGNMTGWAVNESYRMTRNEAAEGEEYMFTMDLTTDSQFKVVKVDGENQTWYPDGTGNSYGENGEITADESYTIYFRPNADGGDDWFYNVIYAVKRTTDIVNTFKAPATSDTIYTLSGQKVEKAVKGLYIINGKKVVVK